MTKANLFLDLTALSITGADALTANGAKRF